MLALVYFAQTGSEDDNFVLLAHLLQEVIDARAFDDINIMPMILYFDRDDIISLL